MKALATRVARIENSNANAWNAWTPALERSFWIAVDERAQWFAPGDANMTEEQRSELRRFDHIAWLRRFRGKAELPDLMKRYGLAAPRSLLEFTGMTFVYIDGDDKL